jgi:LacI family repressor for deo operon, udp, cdd, tsx, nupC, and nupG
VATIKDIAELAGVSIATVSRALSKPDVVRAETSRKINAAIAELGYFPNMMAAGLRRQRSENVIVAVPSIANPFASAFVQGIENVAREAGFRVLLGITESDQARMDSYVDMITGKQADGMILLDRMLPSVVRRPTAGPRPPLVAAFEYPPDLQLPRVRIDNVEAMAAMVAHLLKLGHTRIAAISGPLAQTIARDRMAGFRLGLRRAGITPEDALVAEGDFSLESGAEATRRFRSSGLPFTAICCSNDEMAIGALSVLRSQGLVVPDDVSVVGFDNLRFGAFAIPPLTTIDVPKQETGETAMQLMLDLLRDPDSAPREVILPHKLIIRESSAAAR